MAGLSSLISLLRVPSMSTLPTAFSPLSEQQPAEIRPTNIEVAWPVTADLGVRVLSRKNCARDHSSSKSPPSTNTIESPPPKPYSCRGVQPPLFIPSSKLSRVEIFPSCCFPPFL
ncbi:hypothetical protein AVEN_138153-1 [Araneus ventricosus]|uniref:Uncharacterized protein n=1 Tax=Araneus ventricosus TaxID=182803 RepID=A0A4Y2LZ26_ARAVE|nr:hypothetical protein AVEN_138153-1 [Araneus ventricosus]